MSLFNWKFSKTVRMLAFGAVLALGGWYSAAVAAQDKVGNWSSGYYVDEFGDKTDSGFISQNVLGSFSNSATEGSRLRVIMYINDADINGNAPWFRFYEYGGRNPLKGVFSNNTMSCRIKDQDGSRFEFELYQRQGWDFLHMSDSGKRNKESINRLKEIIKNEGSAQFICVENQYGSAKYGFKIDFEYFANIVREF